MGRSSSWELTGEITKLDVEAFVNTDPRGIKGVLNDVGAYGVQQMKGVTSKSDHTGRLSDSLMWATNTRASNMGTAASSNDAIDAPMDGYTVHFGSGAPHAMFREKGTSMHKHKEGQDEFIKAIKIWVEDKLGINPEGSPEDRSAYYLILRAIRERGTSAQPFVAPTQPKIIPYAIKQFRQSLAMWLKSAGAKRHGGSSI